MNEAQQSACWIEVKPLISAELKSGNFSGILEALFNSAKPFKFLVVDTEDKNVINRQLVRFFIQFPDEQTMKQMSNVARAFLSIEVSTTQPPKRQYQRHADLELAKNYALPICNFQEKSDINLVDRIVATIAGSNTAIEITALGDPKAAVDIENFIYEKIYHKPNMGKALSDQAVGVFSQLTIQPNGKKGGNEPAFNYRQSKNDLWLKELTKNAESKLHSKLFTCNITIHADSTENIQATKNALPTAANRFKVFKTEKHPAGIEALHLKKPSRYTFRNSLLTRLWWITPISVLLLASLLGVFNPLRLMNSSFPTVDVIPAVLAVFFALTFFIAFRRRHPIVLSTQELAQIIGLPTAIEKLSVALGQIPTSRMQLGSDQSSSSKNKGSEEVPNLKEKEQVKKVNPALSLHSLPAFEPDKEERS
jgi:hypothetical protein